MYLFRNIKFYAIFRSNDAQVNKPKPKQKFQMQSNEEEEEEDYDDENSSYRREKSNKQNIFIDCQYKTMQYRFTSSFILLIS